MATRTTVQSGPWSDTATWGGTVPANGDAFNIPAGITVLMDVDQSGMATGMAASVIDGLLHFDADTNTCLKMNGNITGTGALYICERATVTGFTLTTGKTNTYQVARTLDVATVEDTLGAGYLDAVEELVETAIDTENAARVAQGLNEMMPDAVQTFIETTRAALTLSQIIIYVEATQASFYHDTLDDILYIHTSDSTDPSGKTITVIEPINRPDSGSENRSKLIQNATGISTLLINRCYGWVPEREWTQLAADAAAGQNQIILEHDLGLQEGDKISIGTGGLNNRMSEAGYGIYTVSAYNSETKTVTLSANLQTDRLEGDCVAWESRPISLTRTSGTPAIVQVDNSIFKGVYSNAVFLGLYVDFMHYLSNCIISHCTEYSSSYYFARYLKSGTIKDSTIARGGFILFGCSNLDVKRIIAFNLIGAAAWDDCTIKDSVSQNSQYNGGNGHTNSRLKNCVIKNTGMITYSGNPIFTNCEFSGEESYEVDVCVESVFIDCIFKNNTSGWLNPNFGKLHNCLFEGTEIINYKAVNRPVFANIESFDHNKLPGNYKAWMRGGKIETDIEDTTILPGRLILNCESADYPVFRDFPVLLPAYRTSTWQALTRKSFTGGSVKIELIDPANDPLIDPSATPLATYSLPDTADTNLPLKLGYKSTKAMQAIIRISAQNSTGTVEIDTRLIENRVQHGQ